MGSRLEDKVLQLQRALEEQSKFTKVRSTYGWDDWESLPLSQKQAQVGKMKIINIPKLEFDISAIRRA
jgi:hypothetical protein